MIKKAALIATTASQYLFATATAFAADTTSINPCPQGTFNKLCENSNVDEARLIQTVIGLLLLVAVLLALGFLIFGGIKWILSGGDKAKVDGARQTIVGAIIGLVVALASFFVIGIVANLFGGIDLLNPEIPSLVLP